MMGVWLFHIVLSFIHTRVKPFNDKLLGNLWQVSFELLKSASVEQPKVLVNIALTGDASCFFSMKNIIIIIPKNRTISDIKSLFCYCDSPLSGLQR